MRIVMIAMLLGILAGCVYETPAPQRVVIVEETSVWSPYGRERVIVYRHYPIQRYEGRFYGRTDGRRHR